MQTLERERGDDRDPQVEVERLHDMTNGEFVGYVPDTPGHGVGEIVPFRLRGPNIPQAVGNIAFRKVFIRPIAVPAIVHEPRERGIDTPVGEAPEERIDSHPGRPDTEVMPRPTNVPLGTPYN